MKWEAPPRSGRGALTLAELAPVHCFHPQEAAVAGSRSWRHRAPDLKANSGFLPPEKLTATVIEALSQRSVSAWCAENRA